ncbi:MAG: succinate dehydrogenase assembly factor 2 [Comamonadaceae bacterium]|nr:succinate dehydrogenase assembly factor 2 [Comamonadaceae bacterium]
MTTTASARPDDLVDQRALSKLRWRCRRGLLENDIFIARFFKKFEPTLTVKQAQGLTALMELSDNDLLDLQLGRKTLAQVQPDLQRDDTSEVLSMLRATP